MSASKNPTPDLVLAPIHHVRGEVHLPGSKSLSNRALLLAALARGETRVTNLLDADDTRRMLAALPALGVTVEHDAATRTARVRGRAGPLGDGGASADAPLSLHLGNAGTAFRPLTAALCPGSGHYRLHGDPRMHERPVGDLVDALAPLGAHIEYESEPGYPPLRIAARGLAGGETEVNGSVSSQFLTALLMAAPLAAAPVTIGVRGELVSRPYIDITLAAMAAFGVEVHNDDYRRFRIEPATYRSPGTFLVEGDASSATYLLAAAAIRGGPVRVHGIGRTSVQGDVRFLDVLRQMGAEVTLGDDWVEVRRGPVNVLRAIDADLNHITDAAMTVAVLALFADGTTTIRNIGNWRVKETDRLHAMATELRRFGAQVIEGADFLTIDPPATLIPARVHTYDDHRIAMSFSLAALGGVPVTIEDPGCVAKTFPDYFEVFARLCR